MQENGLCCPFCDSKIQDFRKHISKQNDNSERGTSTNCNSCDLVIQNETCLKRHEEKVHGMLYSGIICEECNIDFFSRNNLKNHKEISHNEGIQAKIHAFEANANNIAVEVDLNSKSEEEMAHDCTLCKQSFEEEKLMQIHFKTSHMDVLAKLITNCVHDLPTMTCEPCKTKTILDANSEVKVKETEDTNITKNNEKASEELAENYEDAMNGNFEEQNDVDLETIKVHDEIDENTKEFQLYKELLENVETKSNENVGVDNFESKNEGVANELEQENELFTKDDNSEINIVNYKANEKFDTNEKPKEYEEEVENTNMTKDNLKYKDESEFEVPSEVKEIFKNDKTPKINQTDTDKKDEEMEIMNVVENISEKSLKIDDNTKITITAKKQHEFIGSQKNEMKAKQPKYCKMCGLTCSDLKGLKSHLEKIHGLSDKLYVKSTNLDTLTCRNCKMPVPRKTCSQHKCEESKSIKNDVFEVQNKPTLETQEVFKKAIKEESKFLNKKMLQCGKCDQSFGSQADLTQHLKEHYFFKCKECIKFFENQSDFSKHMDIHHKNTSFGLDAKNDYVPKTHTKEPMKIMQINTSQNQTLTQDLKIKCNICNMTFTSTQAMKDHAGIYHKTNLSKMNALSNRLTNPLKADEKMKQNYQCDKCPKVSKTLNELKQHMRIHDQQALFICEFCQRKHKSKNDLVFHWKKFHKPCDHCSFVSKDKGQHENHLKSQHPFSQVFSCDVCKQEFNSSDFLKQHKIKCNNVGIKRISCRNCYLIFLKSEYDDHLKKCAPNIELQEEPATKRPNILA